MNTKCDLCQNRPASILFICRRPSDRSELVSTMAHCAICFHGNIENVVLKTPEAIIEHLKTNEGCWADQEAVYQLNTDENYEKLEEIGILFLTIF